MNPMTKRQRVHDRRRGSVMFAALAVVLTITVLASCLLQLSSTTSREQAQSIDTKRAFYLAESGLSEAWYGLKIGKSGNIGTSELPASYGDGLLWVEADDLGGGRTNLISTGLVGSGRFTLSMVVERDGATVAGMGFFADDDVTIGQGVLVDSYDSASGPYVAAVEELVKDAGDLLGLDGLTDPVEEVVGGGSTSRVGSNGDIYVYGSAEQPTLISGDVQPGPSGSVIQGEGVTIAGSTAPASKPFELPAIEVPPLVSKGDMTVGARGSLSVLPAGEAAYGTLRVPAGRTLTVQGPATLVVARFKLDAGASLVLDAATGPITLHVTQELSWAPSSSVSCTHQTPDKLALQVSASEPFDRDGDGDLDPPALFQPTGAYLGTLYAPYSALQIAAETEIFGAIAAQSLQLTDGAKLHFDEALAVAQSGADAELVVSAWRVVDLPDVPLVTQRKDPVLKLKADGVVSPLASEAHEAVLFKIEFVDWSDNTRKWSGDEAKFDWLLVKTVVEIAREGDANFRTIF
jgi:hypothetical protein